MNAFRQTTDQSCSHTYTTTPYHTISYQPHAQTQAPTATPTHAQSQTHAQYQSHAQTHPHAPPATATVAYPSAASTAHTRAGSKTDRQTDTHTHRPAFRHTDAGDQVGAPPPRLAANHVFNQTEIIHAHALAGRHSDRPACRTACMQTVSRRHTVMRV